jgi:hypothetical protein
MSDPYLPLLLLFAFRGMITLIRTVEQLVIVCLALRDTAPEHRAPILRALRGKPTRGQADLCTRRGETRRDRGEAEVRHGCRLYVR